MLNQKAIIKKQVHVSTT